MTCLCQYMFNVYASNLNCLSTVGITLSLYLLGLMLNSPSVERYLLISNISYSMH